MRTFIVELGTGVDLHGRNTTAAAVKAVRNAFQHVSLPGLRAVLGLTDLSKIEIEVRLGAPTEVGPPDPDAVAAIFPFGRPRISVQPGGLVGPGGGADPDDVIVMVNAAIYVRVE